MAYYQDPMGFDLPIVGHIYKGEPQKTRSKGDRTIKVVGKDLKERGLRFNSDIPSLNRIFRRAYQAQEITPLENGQFAVERIPIYLPYHTAEENFQCFYSADTQGGGLQRKCTGDRIVEEKVRSEYRDRNGKTCYTWALKPCDKPCPHRSLPKCPDCTPTRKLICFVEPIYQAGQRRSAVTLNSKAVNDIRLLHTLKGQQAWLASMGCNSLSIFPPDISSVPETDFYIRWILTRIPQVTYKPKTEKRGSEYVETGEQVRDVDWLLHLEICPDWWRTAQERWGMGPYKINPDTGVAEPVRVVLLQQAAKYASLLQGTPAAHAALAAAMPNTGWGAHPPQALPPAESLPPLGDRPMPASEPLGVPLDGVSGLPAEVAEILGEEAPFRPPSRDKANFERLALVGGLLGFTPRRIGDILADIYPDRHTSELAPYHMAQVEDRLLAEWAVTQATTTGEPIFLKPEEALEAMQTLDLPRDRDQRIDAWRSVVDTLRSPQAKSP